jgi:hypothetical protein
VNAAGMSSNTVDCRSPKWSREGRVRPGLVILAMAAPMADSNVKYHLPPPPKPMPSSATFIPSALIKPGHLVVLNCQPGAGKNSLMLHLAQHQARQGSKAAIISTDPVVSVDIMINKIVAGNNSQSFMALLLQDDADQRSQETDEAIQLINALPLHLFHLPSPHADEIVQAATGLLDQHPDIELLVVDHLDCIKPQTDSHGYILDRLRTLLMQNRCIIATRMPRFMQDSSERIDDEWDLFPQSRGYERDETMVVLRQMRQGQDQHEFKFYRRTCSFG